jgi:hypothetical protein
VVLVFPGAGDIDGTGGAFLSRSTAAAETGSLPARLRVSCRDGSFMLYCMVNTVPDKYIL